MDKQGKKLSTKVKIRNSAKLSNEEKINFVAKWRANGANLDEKCPVKHGICTRV